MGERPANSRNRRRIRDIAAEEAAILRDHRTRAGKRCARGFEARLAANDRDEFFDARTAASWLYQTFDVRDHAGRRARHCRSLASLAAGRADRSWATTAVAIFAPHRRQRGRGLKWESSHASP
jgi:hypothetical protein